MDYVNIVPREVSNGSQNTQWDPKISEKNGQVKEWKLKYSMSIQVRSKPADTCKRLTCIQVIVRIYRERLHIWKLFADEEKNAFSLTIGIQNKWTIHNCKNNWFLMTNTTVFPRIKNTNMVCFSHIPRRHSSVLLRIKRQSWIVSMKYS